MLQLSNRKITLEYKIRNLREAVGPKEQNTNRENRSVLFCCAIKMAITFFDTNWFHSAHASGEFQTEKLDRERQKFYAH